MRERERVPEKKREPSEREGESEREENRYPSRFAVST